MLENPDFEQDYYSRTAIGIDKIGHGSFRLMKWLAYCKRSYYENLNYYDLMGSVSKYLNEISWWSIIRRSKRPSIYYSSDWKYHILETRSTKVFEITIHSTKWNSVKKRIKT